MNILLSNDDGIEVDALKILAKELGKSHRVWVIAPDGNRSGQSMSVTLHHHLKVKELRPQWFSCSGSPTDCVLLAALGAVKMEKPDLIISGINYGPNLGTDLLYSGTAAAAREGALKGIPSMAVSLNKMEAPWDFEPAVQFLAENVEFLYSLIDEEYFLNVNFPAEMNRTAKIIFSYPCKRNYRDNYEAYDPPKGPRYYFQHGYVDTDNPEKGSDLDTVLRGHVSVTPIAAHPQIMQGSGTERVRIALAAREERSE